MDTSLSQTATGTSSLIYSSEDLPALRTKAHTAPYPIQAEEEIQRMLTVDHRRLFKPSSPTVNMHCINSLQNKIDELSEQRISQRIFPEGLIKS